MAVGGHALVATNCLKILFTVELLAPMAVGGHALVAKNCLKILCTVELQAPIVGGHGLFDLFAENNLKNFKFCSPWSS